MRIRIPYHKSYKVLDIKEDELNGVLASRLDGYKPEMSQEEMVIEALRRPIDSRPLFDLAKEAGNVLIITSDHTRPLPSAITLPAIINEIRTGNPAARIKILIATGYHRADTKKEMLERFGSDIVNNEEIINHDCRMSEQMIYKGVLPSGGELWLNSLLDWSELTIAEGFIEPHFFAGFSGGRKSILPGIASEKTVLANHCAEFIADRYSRAGNLNNNPINKDMLFAANISGLAFILNVVINSRKEIIKAFAGDFDRAHEQGCEFVRRYSSCKAVSSDIVITSNGGYPLDQNIYQTVKGLSSAQICVNAGGVIIISSACSDGHGGEGFYDWFARSASVNEVADRISDIPRHCTYPDQWEAQILARILKKANVIIVTDMCDPGIINDMKMIHAYTFKEALQKAKEMVGYDKKITVIKDGVGIIIEDGDML